MKHIKSIPFLAGVIFVATSCTRPAAIPGSIYSFDLEKAAAGSGIALYTRGDSSQGGMLKIKIKEGENRLLLSDGSEPLSWSAADYLVCDLYHNNPYSAIVYIDFNRRGPEANKEITDQQGGNVFRRNEDQPRISPKIGILPGIKTRLIFPLSYLDGQDIFMQRYPRQLKGTVQGRRLERQDIGKVALRFEPAFPPDYLPEIQISGIYLTDTLPDPLEKLAVPYVDEFGQWKGKEWPGKTNSLEDLKGNLYQLKELSDGARWPYEWSRYGGWKKKRFRATGFFRTHNDGTRWWLVDPQGYAFLSAGIDCIRSNTSGMVSGQEDMFSWLPPQDDPVFAEAFSKRRNDILLFDFLQSNLIRVFGKNWKSDWEKITTGLLKAWSVNTIANWSDLDYSGKAKIPWVLNMSGFPSAEPLLYRDFPDVFSHTYLENCRKFATQLEAYKKDPYLIGYFLSNEPHWAFGDNNLALEMFATDTPSVTKDTMTAWLAARYGNDIAALNKAWKLRLQDFTEINRLILKEASSEQCYTDCVEFSGIMVDQYIKPVCSEVKKTDPNHLNLGMRYAWISSDLCYRAGAYFDVFSINGYTFPGPPETAEITNRSGKPVIIGEYHFGSTDRGLPANGIQGAKDQESRGEAYRFYLEQGFARPEIIGIHYFQWMDQPVFGRFDGENYNIGFLDICMKPYEELVSRAKMSHERMYRVASGKEPPYARVIEKSPQIFY